MIDRRRLLVAGAAGACVLAAPTWARVSAPVPRTIVMPVSASRATNLVIWTPVRPRGVVLFSTGLGDWPELYDRLVALFVAEDLAVLAPVHVDSTHYPDRARFGMAQSFGERLADMRAATAQAAAGFPGLPVIAAGHSYGSLVALCLAGALASIGRFRDPTVKAALAFSSPGRIPGLVGPGAFTSLAAPVMMVTGTADLLPAGISYPNVPADHLLPVEQTSHGGYALVVDGADHHLVNDPRRFSHVAGVARLFIDAYGLDDARARRRLDAWRARPGDHWTVKGANA